LWFSVCSQCVPYKVPDSTSFLYHILFGHGSTSIYIICKLGKRGKTKHASFLGREVPSFLGFYVGEFPVFQKD